MGVLYPLKRRLVRVANQAGRKFGLRIEEHDPARRARFGNWQNYARLLETAFHNGDGGERTSLGAKFVDHVVRHHERSRSQLFQDLMVSFLLNEKRGGFFVEFGAANGVDLSNTCLLEREYQWSGILAEPARIWHEALRANRSCIVDTRCVWSASGERLEFNQTDEAELSSLSAFSGGDLHAASRRFGKRYPVDTISLLDLLRAHRAPRTIDYLSIDTEGSEFSILERFQFDAYHIRVISVEHNYKSPDREDIEGLLTRAGFERVLSPYSHFDDWYVNRLPE